MKSCITVKTNILQREQCEQGVTLVELVGWFVFVPVKIGSDVSLYAP